MTAALASPARLGLHHFAHLRAVAEGLSVVEAGQRYLGTERGGDARAMHRALVERVAAVARRRGDPRWRLLGIEIREVAGGDAGLAPPLHAWAEAQGLEDWPEAELQALHAERFGAINSGVLRRQTRNARLRAKRIALPRELEAVAAERAAPGDLLGGWLPAELAEHLRCGGALTLEDLQRRIARGGRWWRGLPAQSRAAGRAGRGAAGASSGTGLAGSGRRRAGLGALRSSGCEPGGSRCGRHRRG